MVYKLYHYWCYFKCAEAHVIGEDEQDVGRALGHGDAFREVRRGVLRRAADLAFERRLRMGQNFLRRCWKRLHRAQRNAERDGNESLCTGEFHDGFSSLAVRPLLPSSITTFLRTPVNLNGILST